MTEGEALAYLIAYANAGMRVATAAEELHYDRRTMRRKLIAAGNLFGIDPFDFYGLADALLKGRNAIDN